MLEAIAHPRPFLFEPATTALLVIDMQHDFMTPGGWADAMGLDLSLLAPTVPVIAALLDSFRAAGAPVIFTREGYRPTSPIARRISAGATRRASATPGRSAATW